MKNFTKPCFIAISLMFLLSMFYMSCDNKKGEEIHLAEVVTLPMGNVSQNVAKANGRVDSDGGAMVSVRGFCFSINPNPTIADDTVHAGRGFGQYTSDISGLDPSTIYYLRAFAMNQAGVAYGNEIGFETSPAINLPSVQTVIVFDIGKYVAFSGGTTITDGGSIVLNKGIVWSRTGDPTIQNNEGFMDNGNGTDDFSAVMAGLLPNTRYFIRAFVHNVVGTAYGQQESFTTLPGDTTNIVTDIDGNVYPTVIVGRNRWMAENLRVTRYNDGTPISDSLIKRVNSMASQNKSEYGMLYRMEVIDTGNICPQGWKVPTNDDFTHTASFLGGIDVAGSKLKSTSGWVFNGNGTDDYGFNAKPSGYIGSDGVNYYLGYSAFYWTCTGNIGEKLIRLLAHDFPQLGVSYNESATVSFSIRCVEE